MDKRHNGLPPKPMPEPFINKFIKEVAKDAGIDEKVKCEFTKGGKPSGKWFQNISLSKPIQPEEVSAPTSTKPE